MFFLDNRPSRSSTNDLHACDRTEKALENEAKLAKWESRMNTKLGAALERCLSSRFDGVNESPEAKQGVLQVPD